MSALIKKLYNAFRINGLNVRSDLCSLIFEKFAEKGIDINNDDTFDEIVDKIHTNLINQCVSGRSIEKENILTAIEVCLNAGYDIHETIFNVIDAFDFPRLLYNEDKKTYSINKTKGKLLSDANSKSKLFVERYSTVLQRTKRVLSKRISDNESGQLTLQTVDYLLTRSQANLINTLILGTLLQVEEGKYFLEDSTGIVQLDLGDVKYDKGFFVENSFVLLNGKYKDQILKVDSMLLPSGEEYKQSRLNFGNINYFGGPSNTPLKDSKRLEEHLENAGDSTIAFFSDVWLDIPQIFEKFDEVFEKLTEAESLPEVFVLMGNFLSESYGNRTLDVLKGHFKHFAQLIAKYPNVLRKCRFVFVPGLDDPCCPYMIPRLPLPKYVTEDFKKIVPNSVFTTNPCRIQFCNREIVVFRADIMAKFLQGTLNKESEEDIGTRLIKTIISQGHLSPLPLNALAVHWEFDYCLRLYPIPDLIVIGDRAETYQGSYKGSITTNPGPFSQDFHFKLYLPCQESVEDCVVDDS